MKNPWMSMWLSAANTAAAGARGLAAAEAKRQQHAFVKEMAKAWGLAPPAPKRPGAKRRRKS